MFVSGLNHITGCQRSRFTEGLEEDAIPSSFYWPMVVDPKRRHREINLFNTISQFHQAVVRSVGPSLPQRPMRRFNQQLLPSSSEPDQSAATAYPDRSFRGNLAGEEIGIPLSCSGKFLLSFSAKLLYIFGVVTRAFGPSS